MTILNDFIKIDMMTNSNTDYLRFKNVYIFIKIIYSVRPLHNRLAEHFNNCVTAVLYLSVHRNVSPLLVNRVVKTQPSYIVSLDIFSRDSTMVFRWPFSEWKLSHLYPFRPRRFQFQIASIRYCEQTAGESSLSQSSYLEMRNVM